MSPLREREANGGEGGEEMGCHTSVTVVGFGWQVCYAGTVSVAIPRDRAIEVRSSPSCHVGALPVAPQFLCTESLYTSRLGHGTSGRTEKEA